MPVPCQISAPPDIRQPKMCTLAARQNPGARSGCSEHEDHAGRIRSQPCRSAMAHTRSPAAGHALSSASRNLICANRRSVAVLACCLAF